MKMLSRINALGPAAHSDSRSTRPILILALSAIGLFVVVDARAANAATITVDASNQTAGNPHFWSACFGTGKAKLALRGDWQTHYKIGNRELGAQRVRGHGILNDEMGLWKGTGSYDWTNLDTYLTAITTAGMRPIMELDFMPNNLSTGGDKTPPKDYNEWKNFIKALAQHCIDKYGADDVAKWYWEVWNEPDYEGFWTGTDMNKYYTLYDNTVDALTAVIPNVLVGGPATTYAGPIAAFLQHVKSANKRITFVSSHNYPGGGATGTSADAASLVNDNNSRVSAITGAGYSTADVKSFNTEWNSSYSGQGGQVGDATNSMDNHWNVGFILKGVKLLSDKNSGDTPPLEIFSYWALTDVFDEDGGTDGIHMTSVNSGNTPFGQVFGVMTFQGMRKAAFNAFKMLNYLGPKRLQSSGGTGNDGIDAMATTSDSGDSLQILVYNYYKTLNTASGSGDSVTINVSNLPAALANKEVFVTQFLVDETHSNPYNVWASQNKPGSPSEAQWQAMRHAQHLALYPNTNVGDKQTVTTSFSTTFNLSRQAGTLVIVSAKRPLSGRNALVEIEGEDYDGQSGSNSIKEDSGDSTTLGQSISLPSGGWVYFENVDFTDDGVGSVQLRVKSSAATTLELHQDTATGTLLGSCSVTSTSNAWATQKCTLSQPATGVATKLYVVASGAIHLNYLKFEAGGSVAGTGGSGGGTGGSSAGGSSGGAGGTTGSASGGTTGTGSGGSTGTSTGGGNGGAGGNGGGSGGASGGAGGTTANSGAGGTTSSGGASGGSGGTTANNGSGGSSSGAGGTTATSTSGGDSGGAGGASGGSGGNSGGSGGSSGGTGGGKASGCACTIGSAGGPSGTLLIVGLIGLVFGLRRQRARRCR